MFGLPEAKRVRREDLHSNSRSLTSSPKPELQDLFLKRFQAQYAKEPVWDDIKRIPPIEDDAGEKDEDEEVEFRLFAASSNTPVAKIRIQSPILKGETEGVLNSRPRSYHFKEELSSDEEEQLQSVAMSGEDVYARSQLPCPGCRLPWRVTILDTSSVISRVGGMVIEEHNKTRKKKRKGKRARIATRKKLVKDKARQKIEEIATEDKELAERMKRAKKNRDKKLRQRQKEKEKKAAARVGDEGTADTLKKETG